jgi:hypothetical protein
VLSPSGGEYHNLIDVTDDYELPPISDRDDWVEIEGADGSVWAMPPRLIVGIVLSPTIETARRKRRGGRIN